jgi:hypothetical protein
MLHTRALCKRLKALFPSLPLVVCVWDPVQEAAVRERLSPAGADAVVSSAKQAADQVRSLAALRREPALRSA